MTIATGVHVFYKSAEAYEPECFGVTYALMPLAPFPPLIGLGILPAAALCHLDYSIADHVLSSALPQPPFTLPQRLLFSAHCELMLICL